jgi:deoxyribodipyrimidine photo-lyase
MLIKLQKQFSNRIQLTNYLAELSPWLNDKSASPIQGGEKAALARLDLIDPLGYGTTRNYIDGKVTHLSPYIRHGVLTLNKVRNEALAKCSNHEQIEKFIQELAWRDFWQRIYYLNPHWIWQDIELYKTGFQSADYSESLPLDITEANTGIAIIDYFASQLVQTGYIHNHARMYLASYIIHWRRIKWQAGAKWFLQHLLDGDPASNNLSWQWVASTFSNKPYIFNLENVKKYASPDMDVSPKNNKPLNATYEELNKILFPVRASQND